MNDSEQKVVIFTDGACRGNPGPGGWGAVLRYGEHEKQISGAESMTTNNRMELMAAIAALQELKKPCKVVLVTDSKYLQQGITQWLPNWKKRQWRTANKQPVKNQDLWRQLEKLIQKHWVEWQWVKGHNGHPGNELADHLAREAIDQLSE